jgi:cellulose 1,4-beta-cellobiosidase
MECDYALLGCAAITATTMMVSTTKSYAEVGFTAASGTLGGFLDTGPIQLRLHNNPYGPAFDQTNDYSFDCPMTGVEADAPKITAYVNGTLNWGTEPP